MKAKRVVRVDLCAYCGIAIGRDDYLKSQATKIKGRPRVGWHTACIESDRALVDAVVSTGQPIGWPEILATVEARGAGRVRWFRRKPRLTVVRDLALGAQS
jgi:hypothetical protein